MKILIAFLMLTLGHFSIADDNNLTGLDNVFEKAGIPNFLPFVGHAVPGRCYLAKGSNKKLASVLMVSFDDDGFEVAPFDQEKSHEDIFDKMSYEDVLKQFPQVKKMYLDVNETADGAVIETNVGNDDYRGEIRESDKYFILKVSINNKIYKMCNYVK